ncbi:ATP-dependent RNA helicase TDRD9-like [Haemaphysalis longicornis]
MATKKASELSLDDILTVFSATKPVTKLVSNQKLFAPPEPSSEDVEAHAVPTREFSSGKDYVKEYQERELQYLKNPDAPPEGLPPGGPMGRGAGALAAASSVRDEVFTVTDSIGGVQAPLADLSLEETQQVYETYCQQAHVPNLDLPIYECRDEVLRMVETYPVVVIQGATGCGKTTQVPQYILEECASRGVHCNIVVTQPRRIAAISVAHRVCQERRWSLGTIVGYQVGMDSQTSADTRLAYVTTGVLLEKLIAKKDMNDYTHVIIDEVHERDQETDFLLLVVRKFLRTNSRGVKVILMSATFDVKYFADYFATPLLDSLEAAPIIEIPGKMKDVKEYYIGSLHTLGPLPEFDPNNPSIAPEAMKIVHHLLKVFDRLELSEQNVADARFAPNRGAVLIFLPGYEEIASMSDLLREDRISLRWSLHPLHSTVTQQEQQMVFQAPPKGHRKIILSTNIAESSITVPDIKYVIDFCLTKCLVCDPDTKYSCLKMEWASKANCKQRQGRAGRVSEGRLYRMVPEDFYDKWLPDYGIPEMQRCPLELTVLKVKKLDLDSPRAMLALCLDPPDLGDIERAVIVLKEVGALTPMLGGSFCPLDGELTFVGKVMAQLPLDVCISKMILFGFVFGVLDDCLVMAACLSVQSMFSRPFQKLIEAYKSRMAWADGSFSDCLAMLKAYKVWQEMRQQGAFSRRGGLNEREWASRNFLQLKRLLEVDRLVLELRRRLSRFNIFGVERPNQAPVSLDQHMVVLRLVICGAFYPNYFTQECLEEAGCCRRLMSDPLSSVQLTGVPQNQGLLYDHAIRALLAPCGSSRVRITYEESRATVEFVQREKGEGVLPAVYTAVKMRQLRLPLEFALFRPEDARQKMERLQQIRDEEERKSRAREEKEEGAEHGGGEGDGPPATPVSPDAPATSNVEWGSGSYKKLRANRMVVVPSSNPIKSVPLPANNQMTINIYCTHVVDCGHFYAHYTDQSYQLVEQHMQDIINRQELRPLREELRVDMMVLAPYKGPYYRARVEQILNPRVARVFFVDYGNTEDVAIAHIREIDPERHVEVLSTPVQAFECKLAEIRPAALCSGREQWTRPARERFTHLVMEQFMVARVYSVVDNVVRVHLVLQDGVTNVNDLLVKEGHADYADEGFLSRKNHQLRERVESYYQSIAPDMTDPSLSADNAEELDSSKLDFGMPLLSNRKAILHGPFSPLESRVCGMSKLCYLRSARVERTSVNSVLLNGEPQNPHPRLLVACHVSQSASSDHVTLRNTTLMPSLPGMHCLMPLIFAPYVELRTNPDRTEYTGALCGLGFESGSNLGLYPDHDMEVAFDVAFDDTDIHMVNLVRMMINAVLHSDPGMSVVSWAGPGLVHCQDKARRCLLDLMRKKRPAVEPRLFLKRHAWNLVPEEFRQPFSLPDLVVPDEVLAPVDSILLAEHSVANLRLVHRKLGELHAIASNCRTASETMALRCPVCDVMSLSPYDLLQHLRTTSHMEGERKLLQLYDQAKAQQEQARAEPSQSQGRPALGFPPC